MIAMIGARKMTSSRIRMRRNVAAPTMASALLPDWVLSSASAAEPVTPSFRPVPVISGLMSARSTLIASPAAVPLPLTTLLSIAT